MSTNSITALLLLVCFAASGYAIKCGKNSHRHHYNLKHLHDIGLELDLDPERSTEAFIRDAATGEKLVRFDTAHKHHNYEHINWEFLTPDPHTRLPEGSIEAIKEVANWLQTINYYAGYFFILVDAYDIYMCYEEDMKNGDGVVRTAQATGEKLGQGAGAYYGGTYGFTSGASWGAYIGAFIPIPFAPVIGGAVGGVVGAVAGAKAVGAVGEKVGEVAGKVLSGRH